jgi:hypothetical protein
VVFVFIQAKVAEQNIFSVSAFRIETDKLNWMVMDLARLEKRVFSRVSS